MIGVPLGVVLLPSLSRQAATGGMDAFRHLLVRGLSTLGYVMIAITALGIVLSHDVVQLLFGFVGVGQTALDETGTTLAIFLVGLTAHSLIAVLARAFYALQDTATPVLAALIAVGVNIVVATVLVGPLGLDGLAVAIATAAWLETLALALLLKRRLPALALGHVASVMVRTLIVAVVGGAVAWAVARGLSDGVRGGSRVRAAARPDGDRDRGGRSRHPRGLARVADRGAAAYRRGRGRPRAPPRPLVTGRSAPATDRLGRVRRGEPARVVPPAVGLGPRQGRQRLDARRGSTTPAPARATESAPRSSCGDPGRCPGPSPTRRAGPSSTAGTRTRSPGSPSSPGAASVRRPAPGA